MADLIVPSFCADLAHFTDTFADRVEQDEGLLILYGPQSFEIGDRVSFEVQLDDDEPALIGSGNVQECVDAGEERDESNRFDIFLDQLELDARSEVMMERLYLHRTSLEEGEVGTGQVALPEAEAQAHDEADLDGAMEAAVGGLEDGFDIAEANAVAPVNDEEEEEATAAIDLEPMDSAEFGDSVDDIAVSAADDADGEPGVDFGEDEPTAYEIPAQAGGEAAEFAPDEAASAESAELAPDEAASAEPAEFTHDEAASAEPAEFAQDEDTGGTEELAHGGADGQEFDLAPPEGVVADAHDVGGYEPMEGDEVDEDSAAMHTVIDASATEMHGGDLEPAPVEEAGYEGADEVTGEVMLDEMEIWEEAAPNADEAAAAPPTAEFFSPAPNGVGLIRPSMESSWQPAAREQQAQLSAGVFAESAGLPTPAGPPWPEIDPSLRVVAVGSPAFRPELVMLTEGQPDQYTPPPVNGQHEVALTAPEVELAWDDGDAEGDAPAAEEIDIDADMQGGAESDAGDGEVGDDQEEFVAVETGSNIDLGEMGLDGAETQAVEMPPFEDGEDIGIDIDL